MCSVGGSRLLSYVCAFSTSSEECCVLPPLRKALRATEVPGGSAGSSGHGGVLYDVDDAPSPTKGRGDPGGMWGGRSRSSSNSRGSNSSILLCLLLIAAIGAFSPRVTVVSEIRRSKPGNGGGGVGVGGGSNGDNNNNNNNNKNVMSFTFKVGSVGSDADQGQDHQHRHHSMFWGHLSRLQHHSTTSSTVRGGGGRDGGGSDLSGLTAAAAAAARAQRTKTTLKPAGGIASRDWEVEDMRASGGALANQIRSVAEEGAMLLEELDQRSEEEEGGGGGGGGGRSSSSGGGGVGGGGGGRSGVLDWTETLNDPSSSSSSSSWGGVGSSGPGSRGSGSGSHDDVLSLDRDGDPTDENPFQDPDWYRGTRQEEISWREILRLQAKPLTREETNRFKNFKGHLQLDAPEAQELMKKRPKHDGDYLRVRWPPDDPHGRPIHLTLHQRQFLEDGTPGTLRLHGKAGQAQLAYLAVGKGGTPVIGKFGFDPIAVRRLTTEDVTWRHGSCAVVSNSGEILRTKMGAEIDDHDAVFRINYPPTEKFEEYVGSKTTVDLVNHHHARELAQSETYTSRRFVDPSNCALGKYCTHVVVCIKGDCFLEPRKLPQPHQSVVPSRPANSRSKLVMLESIDSSGWRYTFLDAILERFPPPMATALSPDFLLAADEAWRKISSNVSAGTIECRQLARRAEASEERDISGHVRHIGARSFASRIGAEEGCKPSTGWFAILLALQTCETVDAYGFSNWKRRTSRESGASKYHYFDKVEGVDNVHSFDLTLRVLKVLGEHYPLRLRGGPPEDIK